MEIVIGPVEDSSVPKEKPVVKYEMLEYQRDIQWANRRG